MTAVAASQVAMAAVAASGCYDGRDRNATAPGPPWVDLFGCYWRPWLLLWVAVAGCFQLQDGCSIVVAMAAIIGNRLRFNAKV